MRVLVALLLLFMHVVYAADIYEWKDSDGNVTFSDTPRPGAKKLEIPDAQTYVPQNAKPKQQLVNEEPQKTAYYTLLSISSPRNNTTIPNRSGVVNVLLEINPTLREGDNVQLIMDGKPIGEAQHSNIFKMNNVDRGIHTLSAAILDNKGENIITSESITFYVIRPNKNIGPLHNNAPAPKGTAAPAPHT